MLDIRQNVPLAPLTTFKIGGAARYFVDVRTEDELVEAVRWAKSDGLQLTIWGGGSNVLVPDDGLTGLVIRVVGNTYGYTNTMLEAEAGCDLYSLILDAASKGLGGWEKLAGIPGTLGGAIRGNAGAFGPEIKDFVTLVRALDTSSGQKKEFDTAECDFSYRHSFFKDNGQWVILRAFVLLVPIDPKESKQLIENTIAERERRHLQNVRAAGSFFMNPVAPDNIVQMFEREKGVKSREGRVPAGWLIEKAGMKGARVGGAVASEQHPNYLVNAGKATAADVIQLAAQIESAVEKQFGIVLQEEAAILGAGVFYPV